MIRHDDIQESLYDFVQGNADPDMAAAIEKHLPECEECREDARFMRSAYSQAVSSAGSGSRNEEYWKSFALRVESRIVADEQSVAPSPASFIERIIQTIIPYERQMLAWTGVLAVVLFGLIIWQWPKSETPVVTPTVASVSTPAPGETDKAVSQYFRKSRALLVGLDKAKQSPGGYLDLSAERRASRELLQESRSLRKQPLDLRSARVIDDLNRILVSVANAKDHPAERDIELVRGGIRQENLMFRVRMAEIAYRK